jgi:peptidoglycan/LPS O-acetylase OafA/YrhL
MPALDGLRGAAVAAVVLFHGDHLAGGYLGVDLFFVLSGFLITSLLLAETAATGTVALGGFWARRARRLLPALAGMLVGVAAYAVVFAQPSELGQIRGDALATLGYVANWRAVLARQDYWSLFRSPSPLQHTWSLAIEEQFYVVWPIVVLALAAWRRHAAAKAVLVTSLVLAAASTTLMAVLYAPSDVSRVYYGTDTRGAAILLGAALAAARVVRPPTERRGRRLVLEAAGIAGMAGLGVAWARLDGQSAFLYPYGFLLCGVAATAVIAAATHPEPMLVSKVLRFRPLCLLGLVSYGVYLWHWPVDVVVDTQRTGLSGWSLLGVRVSITLVIAVLSFVLLERPIRRGALTPRSWRALTPVVAGGLLALTLVVTAAGQPAVATPVRPPTTWSSVTTAPGIARPVRVLVVGDSVAVSLTPGLQHDAAPTNLDIVLGAAVGCDANGHGTVLNAPANAPRNCPPAWPVLVARLRPDVVLMVDSGVWSIRDEHVDGRIVRVGTAEWDARRIAQWQGAVDTFSASGAHVVIPTIAYVHPPDGPTPIGSVADPADVDRADVDLAALAARNPTRVSLVDLRGFVCPQGRYEDGLDGVEHLRPDGVHYGPAGSDLVGRWLAPLLAAAGTSAR